MSRPLRIEYPGAWYHVMNRGRRGEDIFSGNTDYQGFIDLLKHACELWNMEIAAYCLMPNHYHLLIHTLAGNLSRCMRHINGIYTQRYNRSHQCDGPLFRGRYKSILVEEESYLLQLVRYIHRNPYPGLVGKLEPYPWSSHKGYCSDSKKWDWLNKTHILTMLSRSKDKRKSAYRTFVSKEDSDEMIAVCNGKQLPAILGSNRFIQWVKETFSSRKEDKEVIGAKIFAPDVQKIKDAVCRFYRINRTVLNVSKRGVINEARNVAIYLTRLLRKETLNDICQDYSMNRCSSASSVIERVTVRMRKDRKFKMRVGKIKHRIISTKGQT